MQTLFEWVQSAVTRLPGRTRCEYVHRDFAGPSKGAADMERGRSWGVQENSNPRGRAVLTPWRTMVGGVNQSGRLMAGLYFARIRDDS